MHRAAKAFGVLATFLVFTLSGKAASAQTIPSPSIAEGFAPAGSPQNAAPQPFLVPQLYTHSASAPMRVTATVESSCTFEGNTGNKITMSCSFNTPMAAGYIGLSDPKSGSFAMRSAGILRQQGLDPFCSFNLSPPASGATAAPQPYFSTFEVCF